jgi:CrcB protein
MSPSHRLSATLTSVFARPGGYTAVAAVAAGGLVGSAARISIGMLISTDGSTFPIEAVVVNLIGSLLLGVYLARRERSVSGPAGSQFWAIGVFGSFTTFSAFSLDLWRLLAAGRLWASSAYVGISMIGGLVVALVGQRLGAGIR